jgi:hypothetical protein
MLTSLARAQRIGWALDLQLLRLAEGVSSRSRMLLTKWRKSNGRSSNVFAVHIVGVAQEAAGTFERRGGAVAPPMHKALRR